jgi:hypothetical protein
VNGEAPPRGDYAEQSNMNDCLTNVQNDCEGSFRIVNQPHKVVMEDTDLLVVFP